MKVLYTIILSTIFFTTAVAQDITIDTTIYISVDQVPLFPCNSTSQEFKERQACSQKTMLEFIYTQIRYPKEAREKLIEGTAIVGFILEKDGSISNIKMLRSIGGGCDEEVIRIVKSMPKWEAGVHKGEKVRVRFTLPVRFKLKGKKSTPKADADRVFGSIDTMPRFSLNCRGTESEKRKCDRLAIEKFITDNFQYKIQDDAAIILRCIIEKDGSMSNISFRNSTDEGLKNEIERIFKLKPKWKAGIYNGESVLTPISIPIAIITDKKHESQTIYVSPIFEVIIEQMPMFPNDCEGTVEERQKCSQQAMLQFIYDNIQYPEIARQESIQGTVVVSFVVEKDGSITNPKIIRSIGAGCGEEVLRLVSLMTEKWTPGMQRGKPVRVQFNLPVRFKLK